MTGAPRVPPCAPAAATTVAGSSARPESILFPPGYQGPRQAAAAPDFFTDLNLDQIVDAMTGGMEWKDYDLKPFLYLCPHDFETVSYRQEVMRDLEHSGLLQQAVATFSTHMRLVRSRLDRAEQLKYHRYQRERWFLDAAAAYCSAVIRLRDDLAAAELRSRGLTRFRVFLQGYTETGQFASLHGETETLLSALSAVRYNLLIKDLRVEVRGYNGEAEYSSEIEGLFAKFRQGEAEDYLAVFSDSPQNNHVQEMVLEKLARLYPGAFSALDRFCQDRATFVHPTIAAFDREVQFYRAYLAYIAPLRRAGLAFCYPDFCAEEKELYNRDGFDLALAAKLVPSGSPVVCNDFLLKHGERVIVVTGPNHGGKTTFARAFGQLHYLAAIGYPVPGRQARLVLFDRLFTHFEREETVMDLRGHLENDLVRIHAIVREATPNSIIILNETFNSTTVQDALSLGSKVLRAILALGACCVFVTFIDEFASLDPRIVSMVAAVRPEDPAIRTFIIQRRPPDGLAYAVSIAEKYGITYQRLKERIRL